MNPANPGLGGTHPTVPENCKSCDDSLTHKNEKAKKILPTEGQAIRHNDETSLQYGNYMLGAFGLLIFGGGLVFGVRRQSVRAAKELRSIKPDPTWNKRPEDFAWWERTIGLDKPLPPGVAAGKALFAGTLLAMTGGVIATSLVATAMGVRSIPEFGQVMREKAKPMRRRAMAKLGMKVDEEMSPREMEEEWDQIQTFYNDFIMGETEKKTYPLLEKSPPRQRKEPASADPTIPDVSESKL